MSWCVIVFSNFGLTSRFFWDLEQFYTPTTDFKTWKTSVLTAAWSQLPTFQNANFIVTPDFKTQENINISSAPTPVYIILTSVNNFRSLGKFTVMKSHIDCSSGKSTQWKLQTLNCLTATKSHTDCESGKLTKCKCLITITCWCIHILIYHTIKFNPHIWSNCPEWEIQSFLDPKAGLSAFSSYGYSPSGQA